MPGKRSHAVAKPWLFHIACCVDQISDRPLLKETESTRRANIGDLNFRGREKILGRVNLRSKNTIS
jgi:hypothetical protein